MTAGATVPARALSARVPTGFALGDGTTEATTALGGGRSSLARLRDLLQEARELGVPGVAFRIRWELGVRSGWRELTERLPEPLASPERAGLALLERLPFAPAEGVRRAVAGRIAPEALASLGRRAVDAAAGRVRCFGRWIGDFGFPIDWHRNPATGERWDASAHWTEALRDTTRAGDVKLTWEVGRFPQAFELARAAALGALSPAAMAAVLEAQVTAFYTANPYGRGVHWASGQEIALRLLAWLFAASALRDEPRMRSALPMVARHLHQGAVHLEQNLDYARKAVGNNHLVSEAFGLYLAGALLPEAPGAPRWKALGLELLDEQAERQVYEDGGYLMHSHSYQRAALQLYLVAASLRRREGGEVPAPWRAAMERSLRFLAAHQNPLDGRLPNSGSNDGALPAILSTCDHSDFRPFLQALSLAARGERLYGAGPWDEEAAWLLGPGSLEAPLRELPLASVSFPVSGYHVLRGHAPGTLTSFRCGTLRHRFAQIDMLHVDVFWRGENVLVDGGTYLYNGPPAWNAHFTGGASHNTVTVDGRDQMVHHRRFKLLYWTRARLLRFEDLGAYAVVEGEHDGFRRHPGGCVHRRAVLHVKDDLWIVLDRISGAGRHAARLHWLAGPYPHRHDACAGRVTLDTPAGEFTVTVLDVDGNPLGGDVVRGAEHPPRGWSSRYYGEKVPAPSLAVTRIGEAPVELVSVLCAGVPVIRREANRWHVESGASRVTFRLDAGRFTEVCVT